MTKWFSVAEFYKKMMEYWYKKYTEKVGVDPVKFPSRIKIVDLTEKAKNGGVADLLRLEDGWTMTWMDYAIQAIEQSGMLEFFDLVDEIWIMDDPLPNHPGKEGTIDGPNKIIKIPDQFAPMPKWELPGQIQHEKYHLWQWYNGMFRYPIPRLELGAYVYQQLFYNVLGEKTDNKWIKNDKLFMRDATARMYTS